MYYSLSLSLSVLTAIGVYCFDAVGFATNPNLSPVCYTSVVTTGLLELSISRAKLPTNHNHQQTNIQFFTGRMPFLSPIQQCQTTEGENNTFHGLAYPKLTWGLPTMSLTNNSSWLPWGRLPCLSSALLCQYPLMYYWYKVKKNAGTKS